MTEYYRRDGTPYPAGNEGLLAWGRDLQNKEIQRVAYDLLPNGIEVSTVWLGLNHRFLGKGRPLIFETMLFFPLHKEIEAFGHSLKFNRESIGEEWRYSTEEEARLGHKMLVKKWSKFKTAEDVLHGLP